MEDKEFINEYKRTFDKVCASDKLRCAVMAQTPRRQRHVITPFKATIGTVAAAVMIFAAVNEYGFTPDTSGVISETVVATQLPEAQFEIVEKITSTAVPIKPTKVPERAIAQRPAVTATPVVTQAPIATQVPIATEAPTEADGTALLSEDDTTPRVRCGMQEPTADMWSVDKYYSYLGVNIAERIGAKYTGTENIEFSVDADGNPIDDTAVLAYVTPDGASLRITVSRNSFFETTLSGTAEAVGDGFNAYKISDDVNYYVYATNTTQDRVLEIINIL